MSQAGIVDIEGTHPQIPTAFVTNNGTAIPIANTLEILGTVVAAHSVPLDTTGSGNTVTIEAQYASAAATSVGTNAGVASFNSADFSVDANGFVTISGSAFVTAFEVDASTPPGTNPVTPSGLGVVTITGGQVAAGTTANVIRTDSLAANTYTIQIQRSQAVASSTIGDNGVSHFNSAYFTVDTNGFVSLNGAAVGETITGNTGGALAPTAGNWNILGISTAPGTTPVQTSGTGSTLTIQVQKSQAIASTNASNVGLSAYNSTYFTVDANGFVSLVPSSVGGSFTVDAATAPGTNPVVPNGSGNTTITGGQVAAGTTANVIRTDSLAANTYTVQIQRSQAVASSTVADNGVSHYSSSQFAVDANGFVTLAGGTGPPILQIALQAGTTPIIPSSGLITFNGAVAAAGSTPVQTNGTGANTMALRVQTSQAIASTNATNIGLAAFNSTYFTVDANGFVSINGAAIGQTITGNTGGALSPTAGNWNILGTSTAAGAIPVQTSGTGSTLTVQVQKAQAIASTNATNVGLAAFNSANFSVDANGFVSILGNALNYTNVNNAASPYTVLATDYYISVDSSAGVVQLNFPNAPTFKRYWIIKDRTGSAATNHITLTTPGGAVTFDGLTTYTMNSNYQATQLLANSTPTYEVY